MDSEKFKEVRDALRMSQAALAEALGVRPNTIARWERGESSIPGTAEKLLLLLAKDAPRHERSTQVAVDAHHRAILDALNRRIDADAFELCAADLLGAQITTLVPVRGGSDNGFDGAFLENGAACPLITTTGSDLKGNLQRNLGRVLKKGHRPAVALFATSRRVTPKQRAALMTSAEQLGVPTLQIYEQDWFAHALYRNSSWCKKLLNVTGRPSALSPFAPFQRRDHLASLLGREDVLEALRTGSGDAVVVAGPGFGKTAVLQVFAQHHDGLFMVDPNREALANAIREQQPRAIIVDDAHAHDAWLATLIQLREQVGANFRIIASCWDHSSVRVQQILGISGGSIINLPQIDADTILAIVRLVGLRGPDDLLRLVVRQAEGRAGLAVTLAQLCLHDDVKDVVSGEALMKNLCPALEQSLGKDETMLLACFSVGGNHGCTPEAVAKFLGRSLESVSTSLAALAPAGVIRESDDGCVSVWPPPFRWVLIRHGLFRPGAPQIEGLLSSAHAFGDAIESLVGSRSRGAVVPALWQYVERAGERRVWKHYAWLGPNEALRVATDHPDLELEIADALLHHCPDDAIRRLLDVAAQPTLPLQHRNEAREKIEHWVRSGSNGEEMVARSETVAGVAKSWCDERRSPRIALSVLCAALTPEFSHSESDPGQGRTLTITSGLLSQPMLARIAGLWPVTMLILSESRDVPWKQIFDLLHSWLHPNGMVRCDESTRSFMRAFALTMLRDLIRNTQWHRGAQHRLAEIARQVNLTEQVVLEHDFAILFPLENILADEAWDERARRRQEQAVQLAQEWLGRSPEEIAKTLAEFEHQADEVRIHSARVTWSLCQAIAGKVDAPLRYVDAFLNAGLAPNLVEPFVLATKDTPPFHPTLVRLSAIPGYASLAFELALTSVDVPLDVVDQCLLRLPDPAGIVETCCRRASEATLRHLLSHDDIRVASAAAVGEWSQDNGKSLRASDAWRAAVVRSADRESDHGVHDYWLERILCSDSSLACEWLCRLAKGESYVPYGQLEIAKKAVAVLDGAQRTRLIAALGKANGLTDLVAIAIAEDVEAYRELLDRPGARLYHLSPLLGPPNGAWGDKAALALARGYTEQEALAATFPTHWSYSGPQSRYWSNWVRAFERFELHVNPRVRRVAARGLEDAKSWVEDCRRRERLEAVRGLGSE